MDLRSVREFFLDTLKYIIVITVAVLLAVYVISFQKVVGESMSPNYNAGNLCFINKIKYKLFEVKRGDVITFKNKDAGSIIKRVIGLPGDTIKFKNNTLYINDKEYKEIYLNNVVTLDFDLNSIGYETIPDNMYFVIGDNRQSSEDSRDFGLIEKKNIIGKVEFKIGK